MKMKAMTILDILVSKSKVLEKTKENKKRQMKIMELMGELLAIKLSKTTPPIIQYQILFINPRLKAKSKIYIKIKLGRK